MVILKLFASIKKLLVPAVLAISLISNIACGVDNPDAPDYVAQFEVRAKAHEQAVDDPKLTNRGVLVAYDNYRLFLDDELNKAYKLLRGKLPKVQQAELEKSQQNWIKFRDAEFEFIKHNWTRDNFGSSAGRSRGAYRCSIIENRVTQLLQYAKNY